MNNCMVCDQPEKVTINGTCHFCAAKQLEESAAFIRKCLVCAERGKPIPNELNRDMKKFLNERFSKSDFLGGRKKLNKWIPVSECLPVDKKPIYMVAVLPDKKYTTDQYAGWYDADEWARWPHPFVPTHWMYQCDNPTDSMRSCEVTWNNAMKLLRKGEPKPLFSEFGRTWKEMVDDAQKTVSSDFTVRAEELAILEAAKVIGTLQQDITERDEQIKALEADASRYRFLRDENSFVDDPDTWCALGETTDNEFDNFVDQKINELNTIMTENHCD